MICGICTVCNVSCGMTEMTLVKCKGKVRLSHPELSCSWPSWPLWVHAPCLLTFAGVDDAVGCSAIATVFVGTCGTRVTDGSLSGKGRAPVGLGSWESLDLLMKPLHCGDPYLPMQPWSSLMARA